MYFPKIRQAVNYVPKGFPNRNSVSGMLRLFKNRNKPYWLIEKTLNEKVENFPRGSWTVPEDAVTFSRVKIGKPSDRNYWHEITTFFDKDKRIISKKQKGSEIADTISEYVNDFIISESEKGARTVTINTKQYVKSPKPNEGLTAGWKTVSDERRSVYVDYTYVPSNEKPKKIQIWKVKYKDKYTDNDTEPAKISSVFTEYSVNGGANRKPVKKSAGVDIRFEDGVPIAENLKTENIDNVPVNDPFLGCRFLFGKDKQERLARYFLKEKGLEKTNLAVKTGADLVDEKAFACFSSERRGIFFGSVSQYTHPVSSAAHEAEHAEQFKKIGQLGHGNTQYEKDCCAMFGKLTKVKDVNEAVEYKMAYLRYPNTDKYKDLSECVEYGENFLEQKAKEAGEKAKEAYNVNRSFWLKQFDLAQFTDF